jgi:hypothetical protein
VPEAAATEVRLPIREATSRLAEALRADSIPLVKVHLRDGYLESPWFQAPSGRPVHRRALGPGIVRVRAWVDPSRPGYVAISAETVYRPLADPSLPERELEQQVRRDHPIAVKVRATLDQLVKRYGGPPAEAPSRRPLLPNQPPPEEPEGPPD